MTTFPWKRGPASTARGVAVLLPGGGYTVQAPLLYWCAEMLVDLGWHVQAVTWTVTDDDVRERAQELVERAVEQAFAEAPAHERRLVVGKSLGTFALPWAVRHGVPGAWLTPVLTEAAVADALAAADESHLAVGGDRDPAWLPASVRSTRARLRTVPGGNHALTVETGWRHSVDAQTAAIHEVAEHVRTLRGSPTPPG